MALTFKEARELLAEYAGLGGKCPTAEGVESFVLTVFDYMLQSASYGNERTFDFCAERGCITLPYELEVPLKVKVNDRVGTVYDRWFEYHPVKEICGCIEWDAAMIEEPNPVPIVYALDGPSHVGVIGIDFEDDDAHLIVHGLDANGNQVYTYHEGKQIAGEYLQIKRGTLQYTQVKFAKVQAINKSHTKGYVILYQYDPATYFKKFLANYSPVETAPNYRRFRLRVPCGNFAQVLVLGRIRLKPRYFDNDIIPFESRYQLQMAAQAINAMRSNDLQAGTTKDQFLQTLISRENAYKRPNNGQSIEVGIRRSGGSIRNIVQGTFGRWFGNGFRGQ